MEDSHKQLGDELLLLGWSVQPVSVASDSEPWVFLGKWLSRLPEKSHNP